MDDHIRDQWRLAKKAEQGRIAVEALTDEGRGCFKHPCNLVVSRMAQT
jgi:hypothetical protein